MSKFEIGEYYSREEINQKLHGGGLQSCLMHKNGRVLAGCFKKSLNPEAPETVLIRSGERRDTYQDILNGSRFLGTNFPLFINDEETCGENGEKWKYQGMYKCSTIRKEAREVISYLKEKDMAEEAGDIVAVITFQEAFVQKSILRKAS